MGIAPDDTVSPRVLEKIVYAGAQSRSFPQAERDLKYLLELEISEQRITRATKRIDQERVTERKAEESAWEAWPIYCRWAQWLWSGQVELVIAALRDRQRELGLPEKNEADDAPRSKVADALCYLKNQASRMHYDEYRREGPPITSSHIESTIKQINRCVKGTEKFWSSGGIAVGG